jgi:hypothetical protein
MISLKKRKKSKRKLILPVVLIFIFLGGILAYNLKDFHLPNLNFEFNWPWSSSPPNLIKPIPEESFEAEIREKLSPLRLGIQELDLTDQRKIVATFSGNLTVVFSKEKSFDFQVTSLQFILWRAKIGGNKPYFVDLRFDKPVVKI